MKKQITFALMSSILGTALTTAQAKLTFADEDLIGTWELVSEVVDSETNPNQANIGQRFVFSEESIDCGLFENNPDMSASMVYKTDLESDPHTINMTMTITPLSIDPQSLPAPGYLDSVMEYRGIYEVNGNTLTLCYVHNFMHPPSSLNFPGAPNTPDLFDSSEFNRQLLQELEESRPTSFEPPVERGWILRTFERIPS